MHLSCLILHDSKFVPTPTYRHKRKEGRKLKRREPWFQSFLPRDQGIYLMIIFYKEFRGFFQLLKCYYCSSSSMHLKPFDTITTFNLSLPMKPQHASGHAWDMQGYVWDMPNGVSNYTLLQKFKKGTC